MLGKLFRATTAAALHTTGTALRTSADLSARLAAILKTDGEREPRLGSSAAKMDGGHESRLGASAAWEPSTPAPRTFAGSTAVSTPADSGEPPFHHPIVDVTALAKRPAGEVVTALDALSDTELADLYEVERRNRRRPSVLRAIEESARPAPEATAEPSRIDADDADVREPDELVFTTETPS